jgi:hypothetical protein
MTLSRYAECCFAECHILFIIIQNVVRLNGVIPNVIMLNVVAAQPDIIHFGNYEPNTAVFIVQ